MNFDWKYDRHQRTWCAMLSADESLNVKPVENGRFAAYYHLELNKWRGESTTLDETFPNEEVAKGAIQGWYKKEFKIK